MSDFEQFQDAKDDAILNTQIRYFLKRYAPKDMERDFEVDLIQIVRMAYSEAAKPYQRQMAALISTMPLSTTIVQAPDRG